MISYFLDSDADGHWYLVPAALRAEWDAWTDLDPETVAAWITPVWATELGGHPSAVTFTDPKLG
jgi:hypothetical protein